MILSRRERTITGATIAVIGLFALDHWALSPLLEASDVVGTKAEVCRAQLEKANQLFSRGKALGRRWGAMGKGVTKDDLPAAESQLLHSVRDWAQESGLVLSSVKPEQVRDEKQFKRILFRATGTGPMKAVSKFLWHVQTGNIPVRIADMELSSRKEGADDLAIQIGLSTLCRRMDVEKAVPALAPVSAPKGGEEK